MLGRATVGDAESFGHAPDLGDHAQHGRGTLETIGSVYRVPPPADHLDRLCDRSSDVAISIRADSVITTRQSMRSGPND